MEFQAYMGLFYATKLNAAIAWEKWAQGLISKDEAKDAV